MATREFEATTRIPTRPLSYENKDLAVNKELMIDYKTGNLYVKGEDGTIYDVTNTVFQTIINNPDFTDSLEVTYTDPTTGKQVTTTIEAAVINLAAQIQANKKVIDAITGQSGSGGSVHIEIKPGDIIVDEDHMFITSTQLEEIAQKVSIKNVICTLTTSGWTGSEAPYKQTVTCTGATVDMARPIIDINHTDGETYENAMKAEDAWCNIYRATTGEDTITVYASSKPEVNISMVVELKVTGLSPSPEE